MPRIDNANLNLLITVNSKKMSIKRNIHMRVIIMVRRQQGNLHIIVTISLNRHETINLV